MGKVVSLYLTPSYIACNSPLKPPLSLSRLSRHLHGRHRQYMGSARWRGDSLLVLGLPSHLRVESVLDKGRGPTSPSSLPGEYRDSSQRKSCFKLWQANISTSCRSCSAIIRQPEPLLGVSRANLAAVWSHFAPKGHCGVRGSRTLFHITRSESE